MRAFAAGLIAIACLAPADVGRCADVAATAAAEAPTFRLPGGVRPLRYDLTLTVVPGPDVVPGTISIDVALDREQAVVWLNADDLRVTSGATEIPSTRVSVLPDRAQFAGLAFDPPLPPGEHRLTLTFEATPSRSQNRGIFTLEDNGAWYTMTQFEALSARRAFPCFDEPQFKTPWSITLRVPREAVAISNTLVESEAPDGDGYKRVRFGTTRPLPTYLVAFAVGPWETIELGRAGPSATPLRIIVPRGRRNDAAFAARAYPQLFDRLERWFDIPYAYGKLDFIAIPLTVGFAMENVGLITFGAPNLLAQPDAATPRFRRIAAGIGAHEMAHQWFGNLVTTAWWDDIWLNEAFATWMADKTVDRWRPDYDHGAGRVGDRDEAIAADQLASARRIREPVRTRGDIFNAFDEITYQKGATVIGMFENWVGEEPFRRGVTAYLASRRDGSATADDFLQAITAASRLPVAPAFRTFLDQNGVPRLGVRLACDRDGARLTLTQERLTLLGSPGTQPQTWQIPVCVRHGDGRSTRNSCALVTQPEQTLPLAGGCPAFVFANAEGRGYYVPHYEGDLAARLMRGRRQLHVAEFASLLDDMKALLGAGAVSADVAMTWVRYGARSTDRHVVRSAIGVAEYARRKLVTEADAPRFSAFVRDVFGPQARALGLQPKAAENDDAQLLRRDLVRFVAPHDPVLAAQARRLALAWLRNRKAIDAGLVDAVLPAAARTGDPALFDAMLAEAKATTNRLDRRNLMIGLFSFREPELAERGLSLLLDPSFDVRESWTALYYASTLDPSRASTHAFIQARFDALAATVGRDTPGSWPFYAAGLCSRGERREVEAFWTPRVERYPGGERQLAHALEAIDVCIEVRAHASASGSRWLDARPADRGR